jgi:rhodanese-related sulfurtransferase
MKIVLHNKRRQNIPRALCESFAFSAVNFLTAKGAKLTQRLRRLVSVWCLFFCFLPCTITLAEETTETKPLLPELKEIEVSGPYCGIYSLIAILDTFDMHPDLAELLVPEFVGSYKGSSNKELEKAAEKFGLYAKSYSGLTWQELQASKSPMILHFRSTYADSQFNHWVAYLGVDGGKARIIDLPHRLATIPFAELLAKWDGVAIEISPEPIKNDILAASYTNYLTTVALILGVLFVFKFSFWSPQKEAFTAPTLFQKCKLAVVQSAMLLGLLFVFGILYHALSSVGFLKNPSAVAEVTRRYYSVDIPEIDLAEMERAVAEQTIPLYDARYARDYNRGTIPGAKSLAISSSLTERQEILGSTSKTQRIIVFCQSSGCGYADEVAQFLRFNGYENVVIYRGGYREWKQKHEPQQ